MTQEKFTELVNLYLDKEISERGLAELKAELGQNAARKAEFAERCQLHQAMRLALNPAASNQLHSNQPRLSRGSRGSRGGSRAGSTQVYQAAGKYLRFPRWIMSSGLAAGLALGLGFTLLMPVFRDTAADTSPLALTEAADKTAQAERVGRDPLDSIGREELRRFATIQEQQREANQRASIAAQLRLMGLRPEFTPEEKQLRSLSSAAAQRPTSSRNTAELLAEVQKLSPMPAQQILRIESMQAEASARWPDGFHSSLASFK